MMRKIAVIGAGVIGLSTTSRILEVCPNVQVTVFSDQYSPHTTGDTSAGFIYPYLCDDSPDVKKWLKLTVDHLCDLHKLPNAFEIGVQPSFGYILDNDEPTDLLNCLPYVEKLKRKEALSVLNHDGSGLKISTWTCHCSKYLPWLAEKIKSSGGNFVKHRIEALEELSEFDMIINCSGILASKLIDDALLAPIRGQVYVVKAPWVKHFVLKGYNYILPRLDDVVLGGTSQKGNYNLEIDPVDSKNIWEGCLELTPSIKYCEVIEERVGLRPSRDPVRLEIEEKNLNGKVVPILHNYGHGGAGVSLHWGCALDACTLFQEYWEQKNLKPKF